MKKIVSITCSLFACCMFWSCSNDKIEPDVVSQHDYETDSEILNKFVDVNTSTGEYFINESKIVSPSNYIVNEDLTKLKEVNPLNRSLFEKELEELNTAIKDAVESGSVSQIVYNTYGGKSWVRTIDSESPVLIQTSDIKNVPMSRAQISYMELVPGLPQKVSFNGPRMIQSVVDINMFGNKRYYFRIACNVNATKDPSGDYPAGGGSDKKSIVMSGSGSIEQYPFTWTHGSTDGSYKWEFTGTQSTPSSIGQSLITVKFLDY